MSNPILNSEPSPEEVIELLQRLKTKNERRRTDYYFVIASVVGGLFLSPFVPFIGLPLFFGGLLGCCYLLLPHEVTKIARRLEKSSDPNIVPPLLDALETALKISANNNAVKQLRRTLAVLLSCLSTNDSAVLSHQNWELIQRHLALHTILHFTVDPADLALTSSILDLLKRRHDTRYIATIKSMLFVFGSKGSQLREAVRECLIVLEEQKRKEDESKILLRASQLTSHSDTLLRPAGYSDTTQAQELLRPDNGLPPQ